MSTLADDLSARAAEAAMWSGACRDPAAARFLAAQSVALDDLAQRVRCVEACVVPPALQCSRLPENVTRLPARVRSVPTTTGPGSAA